MVSDVFRELYFSMLIARNFQRFNFIFTMTTLVDKTQQGRNAYHVVNFADFLINTGLIPIIKV